MKAIGGSMHQVSLEPENYDELSRFLHGLNNNDKIKSASDFTTREIYLIAQKSSEKPSIKQFLKNYLTASGRKKIVMNRKLTYSKIVAILQEKFKRDDVISHIKSAGIDQSKVIKVGLLKQAITNLEKEPQIQRIQNTELRRGSLT